MSTIYGCYGRKTGISGLGFTYKDPQLNSNRGHLGKFCVHKKVSYSCKPTSKIQKPTLQFNLD